MVERVIRQHVGLATTAIGPIPSGVNDVVLVSSGEQQVVARFNVADELRRFRKEAWCNPSQIAGYDPRWLKWIFEFYLSTLFLCFDLLGWKAAPASEDRRPSAPVPKSVTFDTRSPKPV